MTPLEKLNAAATRLVQEAEAQHGTLAIRLRETAATIRGATATIRAALEASTAPVRRVRLNLITGDESEGGLA